MPETTTQSSSMSQNTASNDVVFSVETNKAVNNVVAVAEAKNSAKKKFMEAGMTSQWAWAIFRWVLWAIWLDLSSSQAAHAADLVRFRAMAAASDSGNDEEYKKAA